MEELFSERARAGTSEYFTWPSSKIVYNFDAAVVDPAVIPVDTLTELAGQVRDQHGAAAFAYFDEAVGYEEFALGPRSLRERIAARATARYGRKFGADGVILTSGAAQGIALAAAAFLGPSDGVVVEEATFEFAVGYFASTGAHVVRAPVDRDGMVIDAVEKLVADMRRQGTKPKLVYTIATFQTPTGVSLSLDRRRELVSLAHRDRFVVIEDNVWGELRYDGSPLPSMLELDDSGLVLQVDGFSKSVAPALRLGWVLGSPAALGALGRVRQDLGLSQWMSRIVEAFIADGHLDAHLDRVRSIYKAKRDVAHAVLQEHCASWVNYDIPDGGMYFWMELDDGVDWGGVQRDLAAEGIYCHPDESLPSRPDRRYLRMAFCQDSQTQIETAVAALGRLISQHVHAATTSNT